jgi:hypothetical protein
MRYSAFRAIRALRVTLLRSVPVALVAVLIQHAPAAGQDLRPSLDEAESRWLTIDRVELGTVELDTSRVVVIAPDVYQVRTRWRFADVQTSPQGYRYQTSVAVRGVDCRRKQMALIAFADHDGGNVMRTEAQPVYAARWDRVNPESIVDRIATRVCERGGRQTSIASSASR